MEENTDILILVKKISDKDFLILPIEYRASIACVDGTG